MRSQANPWQNRMPDRQVISLQRAKEEKDTIPIIPPPAPLMGSELCQEQWHIICSPSHLGDWGGRFQALDQPRKLTEMVFQIFKYLKGLDV